MEYVWPSKRTSNSESSLGKLLIIEPSIFDVGASSLILLRSDWDISDDVDKFKAVASMLAFQTSSAATVPILIEPDVLFAIVSEVILLKTCSPIDKVPFVPFICSVITSPSKSYPVTV